MWAWWTLLQLRVVQYLDYAEKVWAKLKNPNNVVYEDVSQNREHFNSNKSDQNDDWFTLLKLENYLHEATLIGEEIRDLTKWFILHSMNKVGSFVEQHTTSLHQTEQVAKRSSGPTSEVYPSNPSTHQAELQTSPSLESPIWTPPVAGNIKATRSIAKSELKLAYQCIPSHFLSHLSYCSTMLEKQHEISEQPSNSSFHIKKVFLFHQDEFIKFENDMFVMMNILITSRISKHVPNTLRIVPHKAPRAQQLDLKLIESLDVMSSFDFLKLLEKENVSLVTVLETVLWHLKFCRAMGFALEDSMSSNGFSPTALPTANETLEEHVRPTNLTSSSSTLPSLRNRQRNRSVENGSPPQPSSSSMGRHRSKSKDPMNKNATTTSSLNRRHRSKSKDKSYQIKHKDKDKGCSLVDSDDDPEIKAYEKNKKNLIEEKEEQILKELKQISTFNIHIDHAVDIILSSLLNNINNSNSSDQVMSSNITKSSNEPSSMQLYFEEYDKIKTALLRRIFAAMRQIEVLDTNRKNAFHHEQNDHANNGGSDDDDDDFIMKRNKEEEEEEEEDKNHHHQFLTSKMTGNHQNNQENKESKKDRRNRLLAQAMHEFNVKIRKDKRVEQVMIPFRDGITLIRVK